MQCGVPRLDPDAADCEIAKCITRACGETPQNFLPAGFSVLQFVQRIAIILPEPKMAKYRHWAGQLKDANRDRSC